MRRLSLSTKLFAAALPLVLAVGALLALTVRNDLNTVDHAERGADLGVVWTPLVAALTSVESEIADADTATGAQLDESAMAGILAKRRLTDQALNDLNVSVVDLGAAEAARKHITQSRSQLSGARRAIDIATTTPGMTTDVDPLVAFDIALRELVSIGQLLPAEAGDAELGRELLAVVKLAEGRVAADAVTANVESWLVDPLDPSPLATAKVRLVEMDSVLNEFAAIAPEEWARQYRQSGLSMSLAQFRGQLDTASRAAERGEIGEFDLERFSALSNESLALQNDITGSIVERAQVEADASRRATLIRSAIALAAVIAASLVAWWLTRSVTRRVRAVSRSANQVATEQLPALVEALKDPRGKAVLPAIEPVSTRGGDELAELAQAFNSMQATLVDVAQQQVDVLRRGVSDIFVTMARRNRSLIDRQLAMLDEFEAEVDDSEVLAHYYQLDHMATRMRRNSESLLVLANAEPKRRRVKATEIDDVVRAAIGEVEDYRRIEIEALESLQVRGNVVADISHLLAELLDNATSFSPPDSIVRVGGRRAGDSYMLRIVDNGVGISVERLRELNDLLREPPIVGLSVEPTLGMSVVSLLANRHSVQVTLAQGSPGTTVDVLLPSSLFGPIDVPGGMAMPTLAAEMEPSLAAGPYSAPPDLVDSMTGADHPDDVMAWTAQGDLDAEFEQYERQLAAGEVFTEASTTPPADLAQQSPSVDAAEAATSETEGLAPNWTGMSLDFSSLRATPSLPSDEPDTVMPEPEAAGVEVGSDVNRAVDGEVEGEQFTPSIFETPNDFEFADPTGSLPRPELSTEVDRVPGEPLLAPQASTVTPVLPLRGPAGPELPPPSPVITGEFDRPLAPPITPEGLTRRPVTPDDAHPAPTIRLTNPTPIEPILPSRNPGGRGPDGPDRLAAALDGAPEADVDAPSVAPSSSPTALQNALAAFDTARNGGGSLPTRTRTEPGGANGVDERASITQSRLDPEALRERLRAFQNEFRVATDGERSNESNYSTTSNNSDLGGDPR
jgi:HAMP domain-containing protein